MYVLLIYLLFGQALLFPLRAGIFPFDVPDSKVVSVFPEFCGHHQAVLERFHPPRESLLSHSPAWGNHSSASCLDVLVHRNGIAQLVAFVIGFPHLAGSQGPARSKAEIFVSFVHTVSAKPTTEPASPPWRAVNVH